MTPDALLEFWFADATLSVAAARRRVELWFGTFPEFDRAIATQFGDLPARALNGELGEWQQQPHGALAAIIALDQFPRNLYRGTAQAFAFDAAARAASATALAAGFEAALHPMEAVFLFMPFEHAEDLSLQTRCREGFVRLRERAPPEWYALFSDHVKAADEHREMIERFGRFPHRNRALGRESTPEEIAYLAAGARTYGQVPDPSPPQ